MVVLSLPIFCDHAPVAWQDRILELEEEARQLGHLNLYDVFAGSKAFKRESEFWCWVAHTFEYCDDPIKQNCLTRAGEDEFITQACRLTPLSLVPLGPPCKFSIWLTRSVHGKSKQNPLGNGSPFAKKGNKLATFVANGLRLISWRRCFYLMEQPMSSVLEYHPDVKKALLETGGKRIFCKIGNAGGFYPKPTFLYSNAPWVHQVYGQFNFTSNVMGRLARRVGKFVNGTECLTSSAAYPIEFTYIICRTHFCWVQKLQAQEYVMLTLGLCPVLQSYMKKRVVLEVYYTITSFLTV